MKNSLINMILVLGGITLVASAAVGMVYRVTEEPIALAKEANTNEALGEVLPAFDNTVAEPAALDGMELIVYTASKGGATVGYAVQTATQLGYSGQFKLMVGFTPEGEVRNVKVVEHKETPGLGSKMTAEGNPLLKSFVGKNPSRMSLAVKKDGGEVDALTAATITSRAYVDAVARAFKAVTGVMGSASADEPAGAEGIIGGADGPTSIVVGGSDQTEDKSDGKEDIR